MRRPLLFGSLLLTTSLLAAGCSGSTAGTGSNSTAPTSAAPTSAAASSAPAPSNSAPNSPAASSAAASSAPASSASTGGDGLASIPIRAADLPTGWTAKPHQIDPKDKEQQASIRRCVGAKDTSSDEVKKINSPDYEQGDASITSSATSFRSQASVVSDTAFLSSPKLESCYRSFVKAQLARSLPAGGKINSVVFKVSPGTNGGPKNLVALGLGIISVTANGQSAVIYTDIAFLTGPKTEAEVDFTNVGSHVPTALRVKVVEAMAARVAAA